MVGQQHMKSIVVLAKCCVLPFTRAGGAAECRIMLGTAAAVAGGVRVNVCYKRRQQPVGIT